MRRRPSRRLLRHSFMVFSATSLVLCVAACVLWGRSYGSFEDHFAWRGRPTWMAQSKHGRVWLSRWEVADPVPARPASGNLVWSLRGTTNPPYQPNTPISVGYTPPSFMFSNGFGFWAFAS